MTQDNCPECGAPRKYPDKPESIVERGCVRHMPMVYTCGSVTCKDWPRDLIYCNKPPKEAA